MTQLSLFELEQTPSGQAVVHASDALPRLAREMVRVMGEAATMALINEMGGLRLTVPGLPLKRASSRYSRLEGVVGEAAAKAFAERWGDVEVQVPICKKAMQLVRDRALIKAYSEGEKPPTLARKFGLTEGQVWRVLKRDIQDP